MQPPSASITEEQESPSLIGQRIGHYRITGELGRGGMGVVCLAVHEQIGQRAAVKLLLPTRGRGSLPAQRFLNGTSEKIHTREIPVSHCLGNGVGNHGSFRKFRAARAASRSVKRGWRIHNKPILAQTHC